MKGNEKRGGRREEKRVGGVRKRKRKGRERAGRSR
jgi:hypothetical protein